MALVTKIERDEKGVQRVHAPVQNCFYSTGPKSGGKLVVQLKTNGTEKRMERDQASQNIQFNETAAKQLIKIFRETFKLP